MQRLIKVIWSSVVIVTLSACHSIEEYDNTANDNFEALWTLFDQHYCFFNEKNIDWDAVHTKYQPRVASCRTNGQLFDLCAEMLDELQDGHVNLSAPFQTSYYRKWWADYPQNYNERIIEQNYLGFAYKQLGIVTYATLPQNIGYLRIPSFTSSIGDGNLDNVLYSFAMCSALIIDVRDNGGGDISNVETYVSRFISERMLAGYIRHKNGPGHNDFSEPFAFYFSPADGHLLWTKPIVVLANRSTFSAANNFVSIMKLLPGVTVIGDVTGGGAGMPMSYELPNGWGVRMSAAPVLNARGVATEFGVEPTEGFRINITPQDEAAGHDTILDAAIALLTTPKPEN